MLKIGMKVGVTTEMQLGIGQVVATTASDVVVDFATSARSVVTRTYAHGVVKRRRIPEESRCYFHEGTIQRYGRVLKDRGQEPEGWLNYLVRFPESQTPVTLREDRFVVRSYANDGTGPVDVLADLAQETPFFFEQRKELLAQLGAQEWAARGFTGLLSAKILLFPHQVEVAARIAADPIIRYLLADEVGLGKTIETGIILRQVMIDAPATRIGVFVPAPLVAQWQAELQLRFGLMGVPVQPYESLGQAQALDLAVIDEAHRVVMDEKLAAVARALSVRVKHLLLLTATPGLHHAEPCWLCSNCSIPRTTRSKKPGPLANSSVGARKSAEPFSRSKLRRYPRWCSGKSD